MTQRRFIVLAEEEAPGRPLVVARIAPPPGVTFAAADAELRGLLPIGAVDFNHLYTGQAAQSGAIEPGAVAASAGLDVGAVSIGLIDGAIDTTHEALRATSVTARDFARAGLPVPLHHGTAVASILAGKGATYRGLAPRARLVAAGVFFVQADGAVTATAMSLVRALLWLAGTDVQVINVSLAGPPNIVLGRAVAAVTARGIPIVAAVGNAGPAAPPRYPAALADVIAVSAASAHGRIYRHAGRGAHVDVTAPGVDVLHAVPGDAYARSSGTSYATPFVSVLVASLASDARGPVAIRAQLAQRARDFGAAGRDEIYGLGMLWPAQNGHAEPPAP